MCVMQIKIFNSLKFIQKFLFHALVRFVDKHLTILYNRFAIRVAITLVVDASALSCVFSLQRELMTK